MTCKSEILSAPGLLAPGNTQRHGPTAGAYRPVLRVYARIPADHLAVRFAASVAFAGGLAAIVWWATAGVATL